MPGSRNLSSESLLASWSGVSATDVFLYLIVNHGRYQRDIVFDALDYLNVDRADGLGALPGEKMRRITGGWSS
jgi:hypothetical protein